MGGLGTQAWGLTFHSSRRASGTRLNSGVRPQAGHLNILIANWKIAVVIAGAGLISLWLMIRLVASDRSSWEKVGGIVLLAAPVVGPLLFFFVYTNPPPQRADLRNHGPRGEFFHHWLGVRPILEAGLKSRRSAGAEPPETGEDK